MKIVWALDAFDETPEMLEKARETLVAWSARTALTVLPVYVLSPRQLNLAEEMVSPWIKEYRPAAERALTSLIQRLKLDFAAPPHVLMENIASTRQSAEALSDFALMSEADLILASSHGRRGLKRLIMGSFTETLLLRSKVPVLVTGQTQDQTAGLGHVLVPTDFDEGFRPGFRYLVRTCHELKSKLTLFHTVPRPIEPVFQSGVYLLGGSWVPVQTYFSTEVERVRRRAESWVGWARRQGVDTELIIDEQGGNVSEEIIELAKRDRVQMIAMEAHSGPIHTALIGSITREVARHAPCPVWVFRRDMSVLEKFATGKALPRDAA